MKTKTQPEYEIKNWNKNVNLNQMQNMKNIASKGTLYSMHQPKVETWANA